MEAQAHKALRIEPDRAPMSLVGWGNFPKEGGKWMNVLGHGMQVSIKWSVKKRRSRERPSRPRVQMKAIADPYLMMRDLAYLSDFAKRLNVISGYGRLAISGPDIHGLATMRSLTCPFIPFMLHCIAIILWVKKTYAGSLSQHIISLSAIRTVSNAPRGLIVCGWNEDRISIRQ